MSTVTTYSSGYSATAAAREAAAPKRKGLMQRFLDRLIESRMRRAEEYIRMHRHLLPRDMEQAGWQLTERSEDSLPFVR
jgi:hypothetical protein